MDLLEGLDVEKQVEILVFMKAKGVQPPTRGQGGEFLRKPRGKEHHELQRERYHPEAAPT